MTSSSALREIFAAGRPLIEQQLDLADLVAALREVATAKGLDWSQIKALLKAQIQDERDETGNGKRVQRIVEKAEFASAYADMLGLANMNENNFSAERANGYAAAKGAETVAHDADGVVIEDQPETANEAGGFDSRSLTEIVEKSQVQVLPGTPIQGAKGGPTGMGRSDGGERPVPNSHSSASSSRQANTAGAVETPPTAPAPPPTHKDGCLDQSGCKVKFTSALCSRCASERAKARVAA